MDQLFEHSLVLNSKEPNFYEQQIKTSSSLGIMTLEEASLAGNFVDFAHCPYTKDLIQKCNFISILKYGWNKVYDQDPEFKTIFDAKDGVTDLEEQILAGQWSQNARGRTKKLAQHKAAANVILDIIKCGRHKEFLIPGRDATEAHKLITKSINTLFNNQSSSSSSIEIMEGIESNIITSTKEEVTTTIIQQQQIINWVGRVQELIMKKRIVCKWNDVYTCENEKTNNIMHYCKLQFDILDATANNLERRLEADSQARNKKAAKQIAFCKIYELLIAEYGPSSNQLINNDETGKEVKNKKNNNFVVAAVNDNKDVSNLIVVDDNEKEKKELLLSSNNKTTLTSLTNKYSVKLSPKDLKELEHIERSQDCCDDDEMMIDLRMLLSDILNDREVNTPRSERLLRCILEWKNPQVERVFCEAELKFIEAVKSEAYDIFQVYLEIFISHNNKKILECTFGGEGNDKQRARDDACWQALEYLYIFGEFVLE